MKGYTLLETLVAVCMVGVLSSMVMMAAWPTEGARLDKEARRLAALLELAIVESRASGQAIAWSPEGRGYTFWRKGDDGNWARFPETSVYRQRSFGGDTGVGGERVVLSPHGLQTPLEATIRSGGTQFVLRSEALGRVSVQRLHAR
jgi:general secretion pathway protein H